MVAGILRWKPAGAVMLPGGFRFAKSGENMAADMTIYSFDPSDGSQRA